MSPRLTRALRWGLPAALTLLIVPSMAAADPVSAAILTTLGFQATAAAVAATSTFLINVGIMTATNCTPTCLVGPKSEATQ